jgi:hypothetical protein
MAFYGESDRGQNVPNEMNLGALLRHLQETDAYPVSAGLMVVSFGANNGLSVSVNGARRTQENAYDHFPTRDCRDDLYQVAASTSRYIQQHDIKRVYLLDRSARPAHAALSAYWKAKNPDEEMPGIRFLSPKGFISKEELGEGPLNKRELKQIDEDRHGKAESFKHVRQSAKIVEELQAMFKKDGVQPEDDVLLFDTCLHTGRSLTPIKDKFDKAGMKNVHVGVVDADPYHMSTSLDPDMVALAYRPMLVCIPFGDDRVTLKSYKSIFSHVNKDPKYRRQGLEIRREIGRAIAEMLEISQA